MAALNHKPYCVGLTGGIASGKTTVSHLFAELGAPIIDADLIAHQLTQKNTEAYHQILSHFGQSILNDDHTLNRNKLRDIIFANPTEKKWLEHLLHPLIRNAMQAQINTVTYPYCICVIPLLAESTEIHFIDRVLVVDASVATQIKRATARDHSSAEAISRIIQTQAQSDTRLSIADDVLENNQDIATLKKAIQQLHEQYLKLTH
jgi:dephospho-CoA kinase